MKNLCYYIGSKATEIVAKEINMPVIQVQMRKTTAEQKEALIENLTKAAVDTTKAPAERFWVFVQEFEDENFGIAGRSMAADKPRT
jgi:4-oxalocrotonate tautomerase family enzyme